MEKLDQALVVENALFIFDQVNGQLIPANDLANDALVLDSLEDAIQHGSLTVLREYLPGDGDANVVADPVDPESESDSGPGHDPQPETSTPADTPAE